MPTEFTHHRAMIRSLAERALAMAVDASPHRPRAGEVRWSLTRSIPAARRLLDPPPPEADGDRDQPKDLSQLDAPPTGDPAARFVDGYGHTRPVYRCLAAHLHRRATGEAVMLPPAAEGEPFEAALWREWLTDASCSGSGEAARGSENRARATDPEAAPLHPQGHDDAPDHWTFAELVGLHALHLHATHRHDPAVADRVASAAAYHQIHTQPDYTTYQPWALAAFLARPATTPFAEQQLHDTETHLAIAGPPGALLPGLLLADAYASTAPSPGTLRVTR